MATRKKRRKRKFKTVYTIGELLRMPLSKIKRLKKLARKSR